MVMFVTNRRVYGGSDREAMAALVAAAGRAARADVDLIQIRERGLEDGDLLALVRQVKAEVAGTACRTIVNDRVDIALAAGADGVHLPARAYSAARVRPMVPDGFLIGRSVHTEEEAVEAARGGGCDYLIFGAVFATPNKPEGHVPAGLEALARVCTSVSTPVLAIGGITAARVADVARAGAAGVAAIGLFARAGESTLAETVRGIRENFGER
jgi:thiamine-phosphate diphosphorylase